MIEESLLRVSGLTKSFANVPVLRGLDLSVCRGEVCGLLGRNGAGKTTAINIISGLLGPDSGIVKVMGNGSSGSWRSVIGVAPQETALYPRLSCAENVAFFGRLYGLSGRVLKQRVDDVIELVDLARYRDDLVETLSGGTRRRLNLGVAIVHNPSLLILDEPTAGLDVEARYAQWEVVRGFRDSGASVLLTTHLLDEAEALCDRIALLHGGVIAREGTLEALRGTVQAKQVAEVESSDEDALRDRALGLGIDVHRRGGRTQLLLAQAESLESLVAKLSGTGIRSISLRPVGLEDVFFDL